MADLQSPDMTNMEHGGTRRRLRTWVVAALLACAACTGQSSLGTAPSRAPSSSPSPSSSPFYFIAFPEPFCSLVAEGKVRQYLDFVRMGPEEPSQIDQVSAQLGEELKLSTKGDRAAIVKMGSAVRQLNAAIDDAGINYSADAGYKLSLQAVQRDTLSAVTGSKCTVAAGQV
jgi:hypothetical protein